MQSLAAAGSAVVYLQAQLPVQPNTVWGIDGGWNVDVLWVYLNNFNDFSSQLSGDITGNSDLYTPGCGTLGLEGPSSTCPFPHYNTVLNYQGWEPHPVELSTAQARLLSHLGYYQIVSQQALFTSMLSSSTLASAAAVNAAAANTNSGSGSGTGSGSSVSGTTIALAVVGAVLLVALLGLVATRTVSARRAAAQHASLNEGLLVEEQAQSEL